MLVDLIYHKTPTFWGHTGMSKQCRTSTGSGLLATYQAVFKNVVKYLCTHFRISEEFRCPDI